MGGGSEELAALASLAPRELREGLGGDAEKLAFWLNVYNAGIQHSLRENPGAYGRRFWFFARSGVTVAGQRLSFNAIEHGLLRRSMFGYSLGYVSNPLPGRFERRFRLARRDLRVHFALNCGAKSCPPIGSYSAAEIDAQLDLATRSYLESECQYDPAQNVVTAPRLCLWFRGDFGGTRGVVELLRQHELVPESAQPKVTYASYDWTLALH